MIEKSPRITIVIRAKNEEYWIGKTLELINRQTYKNFEAILVDSVSTDNTVSIFHHYRPENQVITVENYKPGDAINRGIAAGSGELAVILSAHCIPVDENWLSKLVGAMKDNTIGAAYGRQLPLPSSHPLDKRDLLNTFGIEARVQKKDTFFHNANSIIRREIWTRLPFDAETPHIEDRLWAQKVISMGYYIAYEPQSAVYHNHGINHHSNDKRAEAISDILVRNTMSNGNEYPEFLKPENERLLFCLLGHDQDLYERYVPIIEGLGKVYKKGKIMVSTRAPDIINKKGVSTIPRLASEDHLTFVDILARMLEQANSDGCFPNCVVYLNPKLDGTNVNFIRDLVRLFYQGMYDSAFFAREEYNNLWIKEGKSYRQLMANYSPRSEKTPFFVAQYGYGIATKPEFIRTRELVGDKVGIIRIKEEK